MPERSASAVPPAPSGARAAAGPLDLIDLIALSYRAPRAVQRPPAPAPRPAPHYGWSFPAFTRSGVRIRRNLCIREGVPYVYAPAVYTYYRSRKRTYPRIRTLGCVYARTYVYAPTPAYKQGCVNAASGAYTQFTHLPAYTHPTLRLRGDATNVMPASGVQFYLFPGFCAVVLGSTPRHPTMRQ